MSLSIERIIPDIDPVIVAEVFGIKIAASTMTILVIGILVAILGYIATTKFKLKPSKFQTGAEMVYEGLKSFIGQLAGGSKKHTEKIFPIVGAMLIYLILANIINYIPGLSEWTVGDGKPLFLPPTADFNTAFGLAFASIIALQIVSIKEWGLWGHINKYFNFKGVYNGFKKGFSSGLFSLIDFLVGMLDIVSEIAKIISLSLRLFGNVYAGSVLMVIFIGLFAIILPQFWLGMSLFVGLLQAMVFSALVAAYYSLAIKPDSDNK